MGIGSAVKASTRLGDVVISTLTSSREVTTTQKSEHRVQLSRSITTAPLVLREGIEAVCDPWKHLANLPKMCQLIREEHHRRILECDGDVSALQGHEGLNKFHTLYGKPSVHRGLTAFASKVIEKTELRDTLEGEADTDGH